MSDIIELSKLATNITIKPSYEINKDGCPRLASVDCHIAVKGADNCIQYADIHSVDVTTEGAIKRALKIAKAYSEAV